MARRFRSKGRRSSRKFGPPPKDGKAPKGEKADVRSKECARRFEFCMVAVKLPKGDPRLKGPPTDKDAPKFFEDVKALYLAGNTYISFGHVPHTPRTLLFLVRKDKNKVRRPELRGYSVKDGWVSVVT